MIRSIALAAALLLFAACETGPASGPDPNVIGDDEPAASPRREPCGDGPAMIMPDDPPRQTGAPTSNGEPIE